MEKYVLDEKLRRVSDDYKDAEIVIMNTQEAGSLLAHEEIPSFVRHSKTEVVNGTTKGVLHIPTKEKNDEYIDIFFIIYKTHIVLIDDSPHTRIIVNDMSKKTVWKNPGKGTFIAAFLEKIIDQDAFYLTALEEEVEDIEENIFSDDDEVDINKTLWTYRKSTMTLANYYLQLSYVAEVLRADANDIFSTAEEKSMTIFIERVGQLHEEALLIRECVVQLREIYQAQIDEKQNSIMKMLTIVTTIFFPLSIITGWYGMNFEYMPELHWKYGYYGVMVLSVCVVCICTIIFKKKKFW